jgi:hypothetical protein
MVKQLRMREAVMVFDPVDGFAARRNVAGPHPRPIGTIAYRLLARRQGGIRSDLDPPLNLVTMGTPSGYDVWLGLVAAPGSGRSWADIADGDYIVEASSPLYQRLEATVTVPLDSASPGRFELEPGYGYPFPRTSTLSMGRGPTLLRGTVNRNDNDTAALAGITVEVPGQSSSYQTDGTGRWVLVFPDSQPAGPVTVRFTFPAGGAVVNVPGIPLVPGASNAIQQTALYGKVIAADRPARGCTVEVLGRAGQGLADTAGAWLYYLDLDEPGGQVAVRAALPDGRATTLGNVPVQRLQANRVPTFRFP